MPKKKKTRKQKALADVRRKTDSNVTTTAIFESKPQTREEHVPSSPQVSNPIRHTPSRTIVTADYRYLSGDLRKTLFVTAFIIVIELVLKYATGI